jgi:hypothetical protein
MKDKEMKVLKSKKEIPKNFQNLEEEAQFYDTHDFGEVLELEPMKINKKKIKRHYLSKEEEKHA